MAALFALALSLFSGAWAQEPAPANTSTNLLPQTVFVTMTLLGKADDPTKVAEAGRACAFAAQHAKNLNYTVADYCTGTSGSSNSVLPRMGDPVIFLVFAGSPIDPAILRQTLPPQAAVGTNGSSVIALLSMPLLEESAWNALVEGEDHPFTATVTFPGNDGERMAGIFVRCLFEGGQTGLTFEEANTCWARASSEDLPWQYLRMTGGWDSIFNGSRLIYPPRSMATDRSTSRTARELRRYDAQRRKRGVLTAPVEEDPMGIELPPPPTQPSPSVTKNKVNVPKVVLITGGGAVTVVGGVGAILTYTHIAELKADIEGGKYGEDLTDPTLQAKSAEYNQGRITLPVLYGVTVLGAAGVGVGIALPIPSNHNTTVTVTANVSPSGFALNGTF